MTAKQQRHAVHTLAQDLPTPTGGQQAVNHSRRMWSLFATHGGKFTPTDGGFLLVCPELWAYYENNKPKKVNV